MNNSSRESSLGQLEMMEKFSKILISPQERMQYISLRETNCGLSDQRLLEKIIAEKDPFRLITFWKTYENIFFAELIEIN